MIAELAFALSSLAASDTCTTVRQGTALAADGAAIAFELTYRGREVRRPTAILISGAGPQRRDYSTDTGNGRTGNRAFDAIRRTLIELGYAVIIYDERGTGLSTGDYSTTATTPVLAADVEAIMQSVREEQAVDTLRFILLGHSEGGTIATLVASRSAAVSQVILLGAPAWTGARIMEWQHRERLSSQEWSDRYPTQASRVEYLRLEHERRLSSDPWYQFFLTNDPLRAVERTRVPMLVLQGDLDNKVAAEQAAEIASAARRAGNERVRLRMMRRHDHSFNVPGPQRYNASISPAVLREIRDWIVRASPIDRRIARCR